jgi:PDZ domain
MAFAADGECEMPKKRRKPEKIVAELPIRLPARHRLLHGWSWRFPFDSGAKTGSRHDQSANCQSRSKKRAPRLRQVVLPDPLEYGSGQIVYAKESMPASGLGLRFREHARTRVRIEPGYRRSRLGISICEIDDTIAENLKIGDLRGAIIRDVVDNSPAKTAGLQEKDIIIKFDGKAIKEPLRDLLRLISAVPDGKVV